MRSSMSSIVHGIEAVAFSTFNAFLTNFLVSVKFSNGLPFSESIQFLKKTFTKTKPVKLKTLILSSHHLAIHLLKVSEHSFSPVDAAAKIVIKSDTVGIQIASFLTLCLLTALASSCWTGSEWFALLKRVITQ